MATLAERIAAHKAQVQTPERPQPLPLWVRRAQEHRLPVKEYR